MKIVFHLTDTVVFTTTDERAWNSKQTFLDLLFVLFMDKQEELQATLNQILHQMTQSSHLTHKQQAL